MKIWVLIENSSVDSELKAEHGLSIYAETKKHRILFDTGQTTAFEENAEKMGVDLKSVDIAVLSHGHYDHGGGLKRFMEINDHAKIYVNKNAFNSYFSGVEKYIGLDKALFGNERFILTDDELVIDDELSLYSCNNREKVVKTDSFGLNMLREGSLVPDEFQHEQYLLVKEDDKQILFSGCSHKGILNIENWFKPDVLVGGFHFMKLDPENEDDRKRLEDAAKELMKYPTKYLTGHCTGSPQYLYLKELMGEKLDNISAGKTFEL